MHPLPLRLFRGVVSRLLNPAWLVSLLLLLVGCGPLTVASPTQPVETLALPTSAPTVQPSPVNTRVLPLETYTPPEPKPSITAIPDEVRGLVVQVIDGDTIVVVMDGDPPGLAYQVRYLGVAAPPLDDPWGAVALETNRKLTAMKVVRLVRDQTDFDTEGNLLRYVYIGNDMLSIIMTEQGLVRAAITPPDTRFETEILGAESRARAGRLGLWSGASPSPTVGRPPTTQPAAAGTVSPTSAATPGATITATVTAAPVTPAAGSPTPEVEESPTPPAEETVTPAAQ